MKNFISDRFTCFFSSERFLFEKFKKEIEFKTLEKKDSSKEKVKKKTNAELKKIKKEAEQKKEKLYLILFEDLKNTTTKIQKKIEETKESSIKDTGKRSARGNLEIIRQKDSFLFKSWGKTTEITFAFDRFSLKNSLLSFPNTQSAKERLLRVCNLINFVQSDYFLKNARPVLKSFFSEQSSDTEFFEICDTGIKKGNIVYYSGADIENYSMKILVSQGVINDFFSSQYEQTIFTKYLNTLYQKNILLASQNLH